MYTLLQKDDKTATTPRILGSKRGQSGALPFPMTTGGDPEPAADATDEAAGTQQDESGFDIAINVLIFAWRRLRRL